MKHTFYFHDFHSFTFNISPNKIHSTFLKLFNVLWINLWFNTRKIIHSKHQSIIFHYVQLDGIHVYNVLNGYNP